MSVWLKHMELGVKRTKEAWFSKVSCLFDRGSVSEETWQELGELLILADVGVPTSDRLVAAVKQRVKTERLGNASQVKSALKAEMVSILSAPSSLRHSGASRESPQVMLVVGVNGSGKTTSIAKLAHRFTSRGDKVILAAADTFRAAAIDQIKYWGKEVGAEVIAHQPGGDPSAVAFDAVQAAYNRQAQAVIVDTAGRLHTKSNLMEELKKIRRAAAKHDASAPHQVLLVIDATTGQNGVAQAKYFTQAVDVTGIFLTKLDGTAKGGVAFAICHELNIPIDYVGTGERVQDISPFQAEAFVDAILS